MMVLGTPDNRGHATISQQSFRFLTGSYTNGVRAGTWKDSLVQKNYTRNKNSQYSVVLNGTYSAGSLLLGDSIPKPNEYWWAPLEKK